MFLGQHNTHNEVMSTSTDTLRQMWDTRPPRIHSSQGGNAKVAGVCEGIGVRYQIDPTLVRIAFVAASLTFGGGLAAYALAWLCMPRYGMHNSPLEAVIRSSDQVPEAEKGEKTTGFVLLAVLLLIPGLIWGSSGVGSSALFAIAVMLLAWWALHNRTPVPPAGLLADPPVETMPVNLSSYEPADGTPYPPGRTTPPAWDPLGTAPFAWDLPEPGPAPQRKKARIWPWVLVGIGSALAISAAVVIGIFGAVFYVNNSADTVGDTTHVPASETELASQYEGHVGRTTVDLRELAPLQEARDLSIEAGIGQLNVYLPTNVPVDLTCDAGLGEMDCTDGVYNKDAEGETLTLTVEGAIGEVLVHTRS